MSILQDVSSTQPEPRPAASKQWILCVFPLRAGGAVSTTKAERHCYEYKEGTHTAYKCIAFIFLIYLLQVLTTSQLLCLSCLLPKRVSWEQMFR